MDDFRSLGNQVGHPRHRGPEVLGVDVRLARLAEANASTSTNWCGLSTLRDHSKIGCPLRSGWLG